MSSIVDICNRALIRAGAKGKISTLTEDTPNATLCNILYDPIRKSLLRKHYWNFALEQVELAQLSDAPTFEFDYAYQLPSNCLRVIKLYDYSGPWKIIGDKVYTNDTQALLVYLKDFTDTSKFDSLFEECLMLKIAYEICLKLNENDRRAGELKQEFEKSYREAKQVDGMEDYPDQWSDGTWLDSRW